MPEDLVPEELRRLDGLELSLGSSTISLVGVLAAILIIVAALVVARLVAGGMRRLRIRSGEAGPSVYIFEKLLVYGITIIGVVMGFDTLGLDLSSFALFAGALGVGLGFGLQGIVKEFISGIVLIFDKLVRIGDYIELQTGERGVVAEIGPRATRIRNNDDLDVMIPNSRLIEVPMTNWTYQNSARRVHVPFTVAYGSDKEAVRDCVLKAAHGVPFTLHDTKERRTQVWLVGLGPSGLNFELVVWPALEAVKRPNAAHAAYTWAIEDALRASGFEIPYPQQDLRLRTLFGEEGQAARDALRLKPTKQAAAQETSPAKVNDAAAELIRGKKADAAEAKAQGLPPPGAAT